MVHQEIETIMETVIAEAPLQMIVVGLLFLMLATMGQREDQSSAIGHAETEMIEDHPCGMKGHRHAMAETDRP